MFYLDRIDDLAALAGLRCRVLGYWRSHVSVRRDILSAR